MKFWQLVSICRECPDILEAQLTKPGCETFLSIYKRFDELVANQSRKELDQVLPENFVVEVLREHKQKVFASAGHLRLKPSGHDDRETTCLEVYRTYGGDSLEDLLESGLLKI